MSEITNELEKVKEFANKAEAAAQQASGADALIEGTDGTKGEQL